jgi:hypothetical protein
MKREQGATLEKHVNDLRASPLFNLSLASKELFHSNFLAWLCECYPDLIGPLFGRFAKAPCDSYDGLRVHRERRNIDLTIDFPNGESLIVENKVKSIASEEQLTKYSDQVSDKEHTAFLLLSLTRPSFLRSDDDLFCANGAAWHFLSYKDVVAQLALTVGTIAARNNYHGELVKDYLGFLTSLIAIAALVSVDWDDDDAEFFKEAEGRMLRDIRLADLMDKIRYAQLAERVKNGLLADGFRVVAEDDVNTGAPGDAAIYPAFYRGEAACEFKYVVRGGDKPVLLAVLLQGNKIKVFVGVPNRRDAAIMIANSLLNPTVGGRLWFDLTGVGGSSPEMPTRGFNQYIGTWLYRYKKIAQCSPKDLVEIFLGYARTIRDTETAIRSQVEAAYEPEG